MDSDLLTVLYKKYYKEIFLYIYSMCKNREKAEDITQDTFIKAMIYLSNSHINTRAWLYMVARNLLTDMYRKESKTSNFEDISEIDVPSGDDPLSDFIGNNQKRLLHMAINRLDKNKRELIILHFYNNVPLKDIALLLNKTPENIRIQIYRAKHELKRILEENGYEI